MSSVSYLEGVGRGDGTDETVITTNSSITFKKSNVSAMAQQFQTDSIRTFVDKMSEWYLDVLENNQTILLLHVRQLSRGADSLSETDIQAQFNAALVIRRARERQWPHEVVANNSGSASSLTGPEFLNRVAEQVAATDENENSLLQEIGSMDTVGTFAAASGGRSGPSVENLDPIPLQNPGANSVSDNSRQAGDNPQAVGDSATAPAVNEQTESSSGSATSVNDQKQPAAKKQKI